MSSARGPSSGNGNGSSSSSSKVDDSEPRSTYVNVQKQLKYLFFGGLGLWYWQVDVHLRDALEAPGWGRHLAVLSLALVGTTIALFGYLMLLPARGREVDFIEWNRDERLRKVIPILTACIVGGFVTLVITLSPLCAPSPPSPALSQRLLEATQAAGGNLQKASSGIQLLLTDAARSLGLASSGQASSSGSLDVDVKSLLRTLRLPDGDALAGRLGVSPDRTKTLLSTLDRYQARAQAWKEGNLSVLGWTGAVIGSGSTFVTVFGAMGLLGLFAPRPAAKAKRHSL